MLPYPGIFADGRIIGSTDPHFLQDFLPVLNDVPVTLRVDAHAMRSNEAVQLSVVRLSPLGEHVPLRIANKEMGIGIFGHHLACQITFTGYPASDRHEHVVVLVDS